MTDAKRYKRGGIYFDDFVVGSVIEHGLTRTVTQTDNMLFSNMTLNPQPLHIDAHFCATETEWGQPLMNSLFTLGLMIGISVNDTTIGTTIGNLGMTDVTFPAPLFEGDTINCTTEIIAKRESRSRPDAGIVEFHHKAYKQDGTLVAQCRRQAFMRKRPDPETLVFVSTALPLAMCIEFKAPDAAHAPIRIAEFVSQNAAAYALLDPARLRVTTRQNGIPSQSLEVAIAYDMSGTLFDQLSMLVALPQPLLERRAVIQRGGY